MSRIVDIFVELGKRLQSQKSTPAMAELCAHAIELNPWFTEQDIEDAIDAICCDMLRRESLEAWLANYKVASASRRVAIIMAGNIPLVGFFDLLCVLCSGHEAHIKPSSKDSILMRHVVDILRDIEPHIAIYDYDAAEHYDMVIATGGDDANRYFKEHFATTPHLLRGSRHSVAVLDGTESAAEIEGLWHDITAYSGLGCRSISMLFIPRDCVIPTMYGMPHNSKLRGTLSTTRALYRMKGVTHTDCGAFLITESKEFPTTLAAVSLYRYDDIEEVRTWIATHDDKIQCVVSHTAIERSIPFGRAQHPTLHDYADGVDTMMMLSPEKFGY